MRVPCPGCGESMNAGSGWRLCYSCRPHTRRKSGTPRGERIYTPRSVPCPTCGGFMHSRSVQCTKCRVAERNYRAAVRRAEIIATWPHCSKCGGRMSRSGLYRRKSATKPICRDCRIRNRKYTPCAGGCGKELQLSTAAKPMCHACRKEKIHGPSQYARGCRCLICRTSDAEERNREAELYHQDCERIRRRSKRNREAKREATQARATRANLIWQPHEDALILSGNMTAMHCAIALGKTYDAVLMRRKRLRKYAKSIASQRYSA